MRSGSTKRHSWPWHPEAFRVIKFCLWWRGIWAICLRDLSNLWVNGCILDWQVFLKFKSSTQFFESGIYVKVTMTLLRDISVLIPDILLVKGPIINRIESSDAGGFREQLGCRVLSWNVKRWRVSWAKGKVRRVFYTNPTIFILVFIKQSW